MKTVFTTLQCAHVWAQQTQESGRSNGALSFQGDTLYSYSTPIARIVNVGVPPGHPELSGVSVALFTSHGYSPTTGKHLSFALGAASHLPSFGVPSLGVGAFVGRHREPPTAKPGKIDHKANLAHLVEGYRTLCKREERRAARTGDLEPDTLAGDLKEEFIGLAGASREYARLFGLPAPEIDPEGDGQEAAARILAKFTPEALAKRQRDAERRAAAKRVKEEREAKEARERAAEVLTRWRAGEAVYVAHGFPAIALRLKDAETIETSHGAEFPVSHAMRAFRLIAEARACGDGYKRGEGGPSIRLGHFTIDQIEPSGNVRAGCHYVLWEEIALTAKTLKERGYDLELPEVA